jgi:transketolase
METLERIAKRVRYLSLVSTTEAGSGHPTSSLSATELMVGLMFGGVLRFDLDHPEHPNNDRLIFSKGHASPLYYALWAAAGKVTEEELLTLRKFGSPFEGHPSMAFRYVEAPTGSLGQGLSIGFGMALNAKYVDKLPYKTYVLIGDSEMAEGSTWEAIQLAAHYKLDNLVGIIDVNRLGQRGESMYGHDVSAYEKRVGAFGWQTIVIDGHSLSEVMAAYQEAQKAVDQPVMIIAKTLKGKGVSFIEDKDGWHGKPLGRDDLKLALDELGEFDRGITGEVAAPEDLRPAEARPAEIPPVAYKPDDKVATRRAYGNALARIFPAHPEMVVLDAEVSNSTYAEVFHQAYPERFFEMYIAEQNMVGAAQGLARRGKIPFVSSFAAFLTRAFDQIRMGQYAKPNIKFCGSHVGVSIGEDGPSQMGLEDLAMFRTLHGCVVLYPSDAVSTEKLVEESLKHQGMVFIRTTRSATPILYPNDEQFPVGGSKVLRRSTDDAVTVVAAGITLQEALAAHEELKNEGISVRVIDLYSIKPLDRDTLRQAAAETGALITVEDAAEEGGIGEAVRGALGEARAPVYSLAVRKLPKSGKPGELLDYEEISSGAIAAEVREIVKTSRSGAHAS